MKTILAVLFVLTGAALAPVTAQTEHAPSVEQCRADQKLRLAEAEQGLATLRINVLTERREEMMKCMTVDESREVAYYNTAAEYMALEASRYESFIIRHNLYKQFAEEDAAGQR